jgi:hypothetical protein
MEIPKKSGTEAHHVIPYENATHPLVQRAGDAGWGINGEYNGIELPSPHAYAGHPYYNDAVRDILNGVSVHPLKILRNREFLVSSGNEHRTYHNDRTY